MKKVLLLISILFVSVTTTACINNLAIQELNNKAVSYMDKGDTETAICRLKSNLDLDNEIYQTHYNLAVAYNTTGNYQGALEELNKVLELKPDFYDAYYTMGVVKEGMAYSKLETEDENEPTDEAKAEFTALASEAVESYNQYLSKKIDADDENKINEKISELNLKIKEFEITNTESQPQ